MCKHFNKENRIELATYLKVELSHSECSKRVGFSKSAITKEINKNKDDDGIYRGASAHEKYLKRRKQSKKKYRIIENDAKLEKYITKRLVKKDSPDQIAGRIKLKKTYQNVSYETIYQWIYNCKKHLKKHLRIIGKKGKYKRKRGTKQREKAREEGKIKRIDIRDESIEKRGMLGHWEGDTIIGKEKTKRILTHTERKSGYGLASKLDKVSAEIVREKIKEDFKKIPKKKKITSTYDNGTEFGKEDEDLEQITGMIIYRAYPYHSWERGTNENFNGLLREFFPKYICFDIITEQDIKKALKNLNHRPRKRLNYLTPHEVFVKNLDPNIDGLKK